MFATNDAVPLSIRWSPIVIGGLLVALGDAVFATSWWFSWSAAGITQMFQSIAVGVLGMASFDGGVSSAALGAVLHVIMATMFVAIYAFVARRKPGLLRHPLAFGLPYGVVLYVVMNFIVMPLSRVGRSPSFEHPDSIAAALAAHLVFGVACVVFARRALRRRRSSRA